MKKIDLTTGEPLKVLSKLALPIMGSSLLQFTYSMIDMIFVGRLGSDAVASIGSSSFFTNLGFSINSLVIIGTGIKVSQSFGRKNSIETQQYINAGLLINLLIAFLYSFIMVVFGKNMIGILNINDANVAYNAYIYLAISAPSIFCSFFNTLYTRVMGSFGNNKIAFIISSIGVILNIILDPILIYGFNMGVRGAAIATLIANVVMSVLYFLKAGNAVKFNHSVGIKITKVKDIIKLGFPMSFQRVLFTFINIALARIIARFGADAIAAQKIGIQIESVSFMVIGGINGAIASYVGQNYGAKKYGRIVEGYSKAIRLGIYYALCMSLIFLLFNNSLIRIFIDDKDTITIASAYLKCIAFSGLFSAIEMVSNGMFTGIGKPKIPATISIVFTSLRIPISLVLISSFGINAVWISIAFTSILKGITAYMIYLFKVRKEFNYA